MIVATWTPPRNVCHRCGAQRTITVLRYGLCKRKWLCDQVLQVRNARWLNRLYVPQLTNFPPLTRGGPWN